MKGDMGGGSELVPGDHQGLAASQGSTPKVPIGRGGALHAACRCLPPTPHACLPLPPPTPCRFCC